MQCNVLSTISTGASRFALAAGFVLLLSACASTQSPWQNTSPSPPAPTLPSKPSSPLTNGANNVAPAPTQGTKNKVALLVPMTGRGADAGQAMLNAAQLAMFDLGGDAVELMPRDTGGSTSSASQAASDAIKDGAKIILGPLFAEDAKAVSPVAAQSGLNLVSFSTDASAANANTFILGFLPQSQVKRVLEYAGNKGMSRIALIAPHDAYGNAVADTFTSSLSQRSLTPAGVLRYEGAQPEADQIAQFLASNSFNAVLIAANAGQSSAIAQTITAKNPSTQILGTGLWDQADSTRFPGLKSAWYAASSPQQRQKFETKYRATYGENPPRIASLAYDAAALAVVLAKQGQGFNINALENPNGFAGIDGIFRFMPDGQNERGLAVLQIGTGSPAIIEEAPHSFR
jgi:ABC-type branched-subunit amino acid transport system substrate-binding protein